MAGAAGVIVNGGAGARSTQGRNRFLRLRVASPPPPPTGGSGDNINVDQFWSGNEAVIRMSPRTPEGLRTTGFAFSLQEADPVSGSVASPTAGAGGFTIDVWRHQPEACMWSHFKTYTGAAYQDLIISADINGGLLYFQISNYATDGYLLLTFQEQ